MRLVPRPVRAFVMKVGAEEFAHTLWGPPHVVVGRPGCVIALVVLARARQTTQVGFDVTDGVARLGAVCAWGCCAERKRRCPREWRAEDGTPLVDVRPGQ